MFNTGYTIDEEKSRGFCRRMSFFIIFVYSKSCFYDLNSEFIKNLKKK